MGLLFSHPLPYVKLVSRNTKQCIYILTRTSNIWEKNYNIGVGRLVSWPDPTWWGGSTEDYIPLSFSLLHSRWSGPVRCRALYYMEAPVEIGGSCQMHESLNYNGAIFMSHGLDGWVGGEGGGRGKLTLGHRPLDPPPKNEHVIM